MFLMIEYAWLIPVFPFAAFVLISFVFRPWKQFSGYVAVAGILASFLLAVPVFQQVLGGAHIEKAFTWLPLAGSSNGLEIGFLVDPLTAIMLIVVTSISFLVILYSQGYMHGDPGYSRYFAFISLFCVSMLGLVLANNLLVLYMFWEGVGLCSYLLIGFWYQKPSAAAAAKKAFIVTRFGDFGFLIGILLLFTRAGTLDFTKIEQMIAAGRFDPGFMSLVGILIFCGAVGKSAQFPLHVWLPDAMEGPTPVSALIHAATMVAAGVYLVARTFPIFEAGPTAMFVVMVIGTITLILAASMALVANDIKRVMAYSTVSQLGYMMLALGVGAQGAAMFHLFDHAFFKALLFLTAGSVIHGMHNVFPKDEDESKRQDLRFMGGLGKYMPITKWTMLIAGASLAGFPLITSGFWSKDEILTAAFARGEYLVWAVGLFTAFLTAFYMFRAWFLAFWGEPRWTTGAEDSGLRTEHAVAHSQHPQPTVHSPHDSHGHGTPHESPWVMAAPLVILAIPSIFSGFWGSPLAPGGGFTGFLAGGAGEAEPLNFTVMGLSIVAALGGIYLAWLMYGAKTLSPQKVAAAFGPMYNIFYHKYWVDEFYNGVIVNYGVLGTASLLKLFDTVVIDGTVNGVGKV
ncbi:MAG: NADH-quinone oxidoreductase subunit L, partial [Actinobacteria bacterium]|nr:NADH-quinone oxidoreductase subunit L [Actinomycetota bacterium]